MILTSAFFYFTSIDAVDVIVDQLHRTKAELKGFDDDKRYQWSRPNC